MRRFFTFVFLVFSFQFSILGVFAQNDFDTKIVIDYKYDEKGQLSVLQKIDINYNNSQKYVSKYRFKVLGTNISNLKAYDTKGPLEITGTNDIEVKLNSVVAGKGNSTSFTITYSGDRAINNGKVWEINLPRIENWYQPKEIILNLLVPKKMGQMTFMAPKASVTSLNYSNDYQLFSFTKERLGDNQIVAIFGNLQPLNFDLTYHLRSPGKIFIPSDDSYQRIALNSISPFPSNITIDDNGNWLAEYLNLLEPTNIRVQGQVHLLSTPIKLSVEPTYDDLQKYLIPASGSLTQAVYGHQYFDTRHWDWGKHTWISTNSSISKDLIFVHQKLSDIKPNLLLSKVDLTPSEYEEKGVSPLIITWTPPRQIFSLWKTNSSVEISNPNGQAIYHLPVQIVQSNLKLKLNFKTAEILTIPPFGKIVLPFSFLPSWKTNFDPKSFTVFVGGQEITYNVDRSLFLFWHVILSFIIAIVTILVGWIAIFSWRVYLQKRKK